MDNIIQVQLNLHQSKCFTSNKNSTSATSTQIIGTQSYINGYNNSFTIDSIPDNLFNIKLLYVNNVIKTDTNAYILKLQFEKIK